MGVDVMVGVEITVDSGVTVIVAVGTTSVLAGVLVNATGVLVGVPPGI